MSLLYVGVCLGVHCTYACRTLDHISSCHSLLPMYRRLFVWCYFVVVYYIAIKFICRLCVKPCVAKYFTRINKGTQLLICHIEGAVKAHRLTYDDHKETHQNFKDVKRNCLETNIRVNPHTCNGPYSWNQILSMCIIPTYIEDLCYNIRLTCIKGMRGNTVHAFNASQKETMSNIIQYIK